MAQGRYGWLELRMRQERMNHGSVINGAMLNISEWKNEVDRWKEKATRDTLTGLYNREFFENNTRTQLEKSSYTSAAMMFIDVDDFKRVNDTLGHMFGDDVLCYVAKQILGVFRHTDIIARYGGDEFVVFAPSIHREVLEDRLKKLCGAFRFPYRNDVMEYKVSVTVGAAMYPQDGTDYETLLDHADCALYEAKSRGKDQFVLYEPYMQGEPASK
jgi:putative two-component system response regulator